MPEQRTARQNPACQQIGNATNKSGCNKPHALHRPAPLTATIGFGFLQPKATAPQHLTPQCPPVRRTWACPATSAGIAVTAPTSGKVQGRRRLLPAVGCHRPGSRGTATHCNIKRGSQQKWTQAAAAQQSNPADSAKIGNGRALATVQARLYCVWDAAKA